MELFKYLPPERKTFFEDFLLRFTQPSQLNDPYECLPAASDIDYSRWINERFENVERIAALQGLSLQQRRSKKGELEKKKKEMIKEYSQNPGKLEMMHLKEIIKGMDRELGIFSISKRNNSVLMWSHYGKNHNGFVVGFDSDHSFFGKHDSHPYLDVLREVIYSKNRIEVDVVNSNNRNGEDTNNILFTKNKEWRYEKEFRLIRELDKATEIDTTKEPPIHLFKIPCECIKSVILGIDCSDETRSEIKDLINSKKLKKQIKLYQAFMNHKSYTVNRKKIKA